MNIRDYLDIGLGEVLGLLTAVVIVVVIVYRRFRALSSIDFKLDPPDIPRIILVSIKTAEAEYYGSRALWRRAAEALQDVITFLSAGLVYKLNFSVGRYRIKPKTIDDLIPWCIGNGFLQMARNFAVTRPARLLEYLFLAGQRPLVFSGADYGWLS